jgi:hypothetical protein
MLVVVSPAKKLDVTGQKPNDYTLPAFTSEAQKLITHLQKMNPKKLEKLMGISTSLAELNFQRYQDWSENHSLNDSKQALLSFTGEVYSGLDAANFTAKELQEAQKRLRILSGLYGVLKPLDLMHAYRLEMGTSLKMGVKKNLYEFWGDKIVNELNTALSALNSSTLVNLASNEYFKSVNKKKLNAEIITPVFKDFSNGKYKMVMVYAKKARGMMANYIIKNKLENATDLIGFNTDGYCFNQEASTTNELVFYRG